MAFRANEIVPSDCGVESSRDCSCVDPVLFETLINYLLVSVLTPIDYMIAPSGSGVDSSWDRCRVLTLIVKRI